MKNREVKGISSDERGKRLFLELQQQWTAVFSWKRQNWIDFTIFELSWEWADYSGRFEFVLGLVGFRFTATYIFDESFNDELMSTREKIERELRGRTGMPNAEIRDPHGVLKDLARYEDDGGSDD